MADIWDNLNTTKLGDDPASVIDTQTRNIHLERENQQVLSDVNLINKATFRTDGGIIPGTIEAKVGAFTDNGQITIIEPAAGEIWQVLYPLAKVTSGSVSTTVGYELWIQDNATGVLYRIYYYPSTSSSPIPNEDASLWAAPLFIGEGQSLVAEIGSFSATGINWGVLAGRVR